MYWIFMRFVPMINRIVHTLLCHTIFLKNEETILKCTFSSTVQYLHAHASYESDCDRYIYEW